jgi:hypothetical protein
MAGIIAQKSHINAKDVTHHVPLIYKLLESHGAHFMPIYSIALDFFSPLEENNYDAIRKPNANTVINLAGFTHSSASSQDEKKAVSMLKKLNLLYTRAMPLVVQSFKELQLSNLGLHPIQVFLNVLLPKNDCPIKPILFTGCKWATGHSVQLANRINLLVDCTLKWPNLHIKQSKKDNKGTKDPSMISFSSFYSPGWAYSANTRASIPTAMSVILCLLLSVSVPFIICLFGDIWYMWHATQSAKPNQYARSSKQSAGTFVHQLVLKHPDKLGELLVQWVTQAMTLQDCVWYFSLVTLNFQLKNLYRLVELLWRTPSPETNSKLTLSDVYSFIMDTGFYMWISPSNKHLHMENAMLSVGQNGWCVGIGLQTFHKICYELDHKMFEAVN